jgi:ABC-type ATPase involved in cell division
VGKCTLAATLLRFVEPAAGTLELVGADGSVDLCRVQPDELRRVIGWCAQDAHVFDSTLAANLLLARPDATDAQLLEALQAVRLDEWVDSLPDGLQTMVGEHGAAMSGGERQRLSLARVVLSGAGIVLIDEPTEHLDDTTAASVLDDLLAATRGRTVLVVTHRVHLLASRVDAVTLTLRHVTRRSNRLLTDSRNFQPPQQTPGMNPDTSSSAAAGRFSVLAGGHRLLAACPTKSTAGTTTTPTTSSSATTSPTPRHHRCPAVVPEETAGPFPGDGSNGPDALSDPAVVRRDITTSFGSYTGTATGVPTTIELTVLDSTTCAPLQGAAVYLWHADKDGRYSMYTAPEANYYGGRGG